MVQRQHKTTFFLALILGLGGLWVVVGWAGAQESPTGAALHLNQILAEQTQAAVSAAYTATASHELGLVSTQVAIQHGTEMALAVQLTQQSAGLEATRQVATLQADQAQSTSQARAVATQTAQAEAAGTQIALGQATATQLAYQAATAGALSAQAEAAREAQLQARTLAWNSAWRTIWVIVFLAAVIGLGLVIARSLPWVLLRFLGTQRWKDKPITIIPQGSRGVAVADISRALGPGLLITDKQGLKTEGAAANLELQAQVVAGAQQTESLLALPAEGVRSVLPNALSPQTKAQSPYQILPPDQAVLALLAPPETLQVIDAEWRDV